MEVLQIESAGCCVEVARVPETRVAVVGDNCIDVYQAGSTRSAVGGNALNVAVGLARHGIPTEYIGEVGDDDYGRRVLAAAKGAGVRVDRVHVVGGSTWTAFIAVDEDGTAKVQSEDPGACGPYTLWDDEVDLLAGFDHVHMANLHRPGAVIRDLRERGVSTSYDYGKATGWDPVDVPQIAFASCDQDDALDRGVQMVREACSRGAQLAVVTLGAAGSVAFDGHRIHFQSAKPIVPIDTLGAGDSYIAAFLASRFAGSSVDKAMIAASDAASATCLHWSGWPQPLVTPYGERSRS